ncbi:MAG TPA: aromatic-ring-hydroxylating dioxygenase subunit beta [Burkholderiales bacterium]|nr:aromatic-ring-hydroxylating dioxygenase subunit beta [Burkholderiales bacterium]
MNQKLLQLNAAYARALDDDRLEEWPGFFVEDCVYKVTSADNYAKGYEAGLIYGDSRGMLQDRVTALRKANVYERQAYRHIVGVPVLLGEEAGAQRAETSFLVVRIMRDGKMDLFACGRYLDRVVEVAGAVKFKERLVVCDSSRIDTLIAIPL